MQGSQIRRSFLDYFQRHDHLVVPSSSLVPHNDPTVLLTVAGMQQMIPYFIGAEQPPAPRLVSVQKCFRTVDIDKIGNQRTLTFFEMLGNFSVGDYFKEEAIHYAWEYLTEVVRLDAARLWPTTHPEDDEAYTIWRDRIGVPVERLVRLDENWWGPTGASGPCGPDSEIYYDRGEEHGCGTPTCQPGCDCERFLEVWNLVFMQFYQDPDGARAPLPRSNIDTGMGLERLAMLLQGKPSIYETDLFMPIIQRAAELTGHAYGQEEQTDFALRVLADHSRAITFLIADGVLPSNEGRGYILRRMLRRAVRYGRLLGLEGPFLRRTVDVVVDQMGDVYPEVRTRRAHVLSVIQHEEEQFGRTLAMGLARFESLAQSLETAGQRQVPGSEAFRLYDTYGFPLDLTIELARERGLGVDTDAFDTAMQAQREQARAAHKFKGASHQTVEFLGAEKLPPTRFVGYTDTAAAAQVLAIVGPNGPAPAAEAGDIVEIVLDTTPFYAEAGGQIADIGEIRSEHGRFEVDDVQRPVAGITVHRGRVTEGFLQVGDSVDADIDVPRRLSIQRNHTATHLIHKALHLVLGPHATQAGSLVAPDRLRFDFSHGAQVSPAELRQVEQIANEQVRRDSAVNAQILPLQDALQQGAMALFGEKYGDEVRVITIDDYSRELCGGTHVATTGQIGSIVITGETSVGSGLRRLEAVTGAGAEEYVASVRTTTNDLSRQLRVPVTELGTAIQSLQERLRESERRILELQTRMASNQAATLLANTTTINGINVVAARADVSSVDALKQLGDQLRDRLGSAVVVLGTVIDSRPALVAMASKDVVAQGVSAGALVKQVASMLGGGGGGRPDMAQAGGGNPGQLDEALAQVAQLIDAQLSKV